MTSNVEAAFDEAEEAVGGGFTTLVNQLADRVGLRANARAVFGDPVERDGVTVIPVAKVRYGFGGGGGVNAEAEGEANQGAGGGGGVSASPVGYIEIRDGRAEFVRIPDFTSNWPVILAGGIAAWLGLRGLRALFR